VGRITAGCGGSGSGGGVPSGRVGAQQFTYEGDVSQLGNGAAVVAVQWMMNCDLFPTGKLLTCDLSMFASQDTANVNGVALVYLGGTHGALDGTLILAVAWALGTYVVVHASAATIANPGGRQPLKVALQNQDAPSSGAAATCDLQGLSLVWTT